MTISIYFDDDFVTGRRARTLRAAGFDVLLPISAGTSGATDPVHLTTAGALGRVLVSHNIQDFQSLHTEWMMSARHHAGIVLLPQRLGFSPEEIARRFTRLRSLFGDARLDDELLFLANFS